MVIPRGQQSAIFTRMTIDSASPRVTWTSLGVELLIGIVVVSIAWAAGIRPVVAAEITSAQIVPAQLSMGRNLRAPPQAARKKVTAPAKPEAGLTPQEQKRLAEALNQLTPESRKRLAKVVKHLTPEQRRQLLAVVKRQLAKKGTASQLTYHPR
jgi:hypothetical protein